MRKEVAVARRLHREGFPAGRVVEDLEQPLVVDGHPVTFWHLIRGDGRKPAYGELGALLELHGLTPTGLDLPPYDAFGRSALRIERAPGIPEDDRRFLRALHAELRGAVAELQFGRVDELGTQHSRCRSSGFGLRLPRDLRLFSRREEGHEASFH
ncbi:hypothetical protein ABT104_16485 [Streptomyces mobaraensis]|uniref:hypothetical protein n=1 Tax=Streptomyces mobaraensis TaxID=35621 RepID=UPI003323A6AC